MIYTNSVLIKRLNYSFWIDFCFLLHVFFFSSSEKQVALLVQWFMESVTASLRWFSNIIGLNHWLALCWPHHSNTENKAISKSNQTRKWVPAWRELNGAARDTQVQFQAAVLLVWPAAPLETVASISGWEASVLVVALATSTRWPACLDRGGWDLKVSPSVTIHQH